VVKNNFGGVLMCSQCGKEVCECGWVEFCAVGGEQGIVAIANGLDLILVGVKNSFGACKCEAVAIEVQRAEARIEKLMSRVGDVSRGEDTFYKFAESDFMELQYGLDLLVRHTTDIVQGENFGRSTILAASLGEYRNLIWAVKKALGKVEKEVFGHD
jgi:hypothetical protein